MAKTRNGSKYELDNFDFGSDLDIPDFAPTGSKVKEDRKPAMKFARGFAGGVKDTATGPAFIAKTMKQALPKGYGMGIDLVDEAGGSLRSLYDNATKEVRPALNDMKRFTARVMPKGGHYLPKKVADKLKKWAASTDDAAGLSADAAREQGLQLQLGEIFGAQIEQQAEQAAQQDVKDKIKEGIEQARHRDMLGQLDAIRKSALQQTAYMTGVMSKVQRKSLELQFRQYFAAKDTLQEMRRFNTIAEQQMAEIKKNTGLPDYVKLQGHEAFSQVMRNKFWGSLADGVFDRRRDFVRNLVGTFGKSIMSKVQGFAGGMREAVSMANMGMDMMDSMGGMVSPHELAANLAGSGATHLAGGFLAKKLAPKLAKHRGLMKFGNGLEYGVNNLPQILQQWARSGKGFGAGGGMFDGLIGFAKDLINQSMSGTDVQMQRDHSSNLNKPSVYTRAAHKSITEVIPGYLARIFRELQIMRTGDQATELTHYNFDRNKFMGERANKKQSFDSLFGWGRKATREHTDSFIDKIDPEKKLSAEQRSELGRLLLKDNLNNGLLSKDRMTNAGSGVFGASKHGQVYADLFGKALDNDHSGQKRNNLASEFAKLGQYTQDARARIQDHLNLGNSEHLYESGVVDRESGQLNLDKMLGYHYDQDYNPAAPGQRRRRRGKGGIPGYAKGGMHAGGAALVGEDGAELKVSGPARFYNKNETRQLLRDSGVKAKSPLLQLVGHIDSTLQRIEHQLQNGVIAFNGQEMMQALGSRGRSLWQRLKTRGKDLGKHVEDKARGLNMTLGDAFGRLWDSSRNLTGKATGVLGSSVGGMWKAGTATARTGLQAARTLGKKWVGDADVYLKGEVIPRLTAWKLAAGQYKDQATGKVIQSYKDITGNVVDEFGKVVLTAEEAKQAFLKNGWGQKALAGLTSLKEGAQKLFGFLAGGLPPAIKMVKDTAKKVWNFLVNHPQDVYVKGKMDKAALRASVMGAGGYFSKLTQRPVRHPGEIDGAVLDSEGNEALSAADIQQGLVDRFGLPLRTRGSRLLGAGLAGVGFLARKAGAVMRWMGGKLKGMPGAIGRGFDKLTGGLHFGLGWGDNNDTVDLLTQIRDLLDSRLPAGGLGGSGIGPDIDLNDLERAGKGKAGGVGTAAEKAAGAAGKTGRFGRLGRWAGRAGGMLGKAGSALGGLGRGALGMGMKGLGLAGAAYGAYSTYDDLKQGNYGSAAVDAGLTGLGVATSGASLAGLGGGLATAAGWAGGALATVGGGLAALAASPVVLGALAVAAVAGAGYLGYKYFSRKKLGKLSKLRWAQYGWPESDTDKLSVVFGLEDKLKKALKWESEGPKLDLDKVEAKGILDDFGVKAGDSQALHRFSQWFQYRFKPVFLTHAAAIKAVADDKWLDDVDALKGAQAKRYLELTRFDNGPYNYTESPFAGGGALLDASGVSGVAAAVASDIDKEKTDEAAKGGTPAQTAAAIAAKPDEAAAGSATADTKTMGGPANPAQAVRLADQSGGATVSAVAGFTGFALTGAGKLDALTVIRYKTYGLSEMVVEKARALAMLEVEMLKRLKYDSKAVARFEGSIDRVLEICGPAFGVTGSANDAAYDWKSWFNTRFIPVFLNFATAMAQVTGKTDFAAGDVRNLPETVFRQLKENQAVDVAQAIYTTSGVWSQTASPWPGYVLNTEVRSVEANFEALKEQAKKMVVDEQRGSKDSKGVGKDNGAGMTDGTNGAGKSIAARAYDSVSSAAGSLWNKVREVGSVVGTGVYNATHDDPNVSLAGGKVSQLGEGTGGALDKLPMPKGDGKWEYFKDLFEAAAKMVGVDPKLMASISAIESGFHASIKNPLGSATGLFQFTAETWGTMMHKYGAKFGIPPGTPATDPRANALLGAVFIRDNFQALKGVKSEISDTDIYMAHFLGSGGAKTFFKADPNAPIGKVLPKIVAQNPNIVWKDKGRTQMRTVAEVYAYMNSKVRSRGKQFGLDGAGAGSLEASTSAAGAGRGSINPDMAADAAPAIPVADQQPAPVAAASASAASVSSTDSSAAAAPDDTPAAGQGFLPTAASRSQDVMAVQQAQREDLNKSLGSLNDAAVQHLGVSRDILTVMRSVERILANKLGLGSQDNSSSAAASDDQSAAAKPARDKPSAPVSMAKMREAW